MHTSNQTSGQREVQQQPLPFWDPHFHVWNVVNGPHNRGALGDCCDASKGGYPIYTLAQYEAHVDEALALGVVPIGGVVVEALPSSNEPIEEMRWVAEHVTKHRRSQTTGARLYELVGRVSLLRDGGSANCVRDAVAFNHIENRCRCCESPAPSGSDLRICGLREILNFNPTWPLLDRNLLEDEAWLDAFAANVAGRTSNVETASLCDKLRVFELHVNPHQIPLATERLVARFPEVSFVLNHLGCLKITPGMTTEQREAAFKQWDSAVAAFAAFPNTYLKLSGASYVQPHYWEKRSDDGDREEAAPTPSWPTRLVNAALRHFGVDRLFAATNYPVSLQSGCTPQRYFTWLLRETDVKDLPDSAKAKILSLNALRVYRPAQQDHHQLPTSILTI